MDCPGPKPTTTLASSSVSTHSSARASALLIEAAPDQQEALRRALGEGGLDTEAVGSLAEAAEATQAANFALLLLPLGVAAAATAEQLDTLRANQPQAALLLLRSDPQREVPRTLDRHRIAALVEWPAGANALCGLACDIVRAQLDAESGLSEATTVPARGRYRGEVALIEAPTTNGQRRAAIVQAALPDYEVIVLPRLGEALRRLEEALPACVFTRLSLQDARGLDAVRALRAATPTTPVVVLACRGEESMALEALRAGAQDYLVEHEVTPECVRRAALFAMERSRPAPAALAHATVSGVCGPVAFEMRARAALARACRDRSQLALGVVRLQKANATHRHEALGPVALDRARAAASDCLREYDSAFWLEDNSLGIVMDGIDDDEGSDAPARRLLSKLRKPIALPSGSLQLDVTVGIAVYPTDADSAEDLIRGADMAATRGQAAGGNLVEYYDERLSTRLRARHRMTRLVSRIVRGKKFLLRYEPQRSPRTDRLISLEAHLYWQTKGGEARSAERLIPLLEERGESRRLTHWMLSEACQQVREWRRERPEVRVSVNLTLLQLTDRHLRSKLRAALSSARVPADCLELEIPERALEHPAARAALAGAAQLGVRLVIDGFGTETPLSCLAGLEIQGIKLWPALARSQSPNRGPDALTRAVTELAHSLKLEVTVLGVSSDEERERLRRIGCDRAQGPLYGVAAPAARLLEQADDEGTALGPGTKPAAELTSS